MILKMLLFERVEAMEYEVVEVKMPKGMVPAGYELIVCENDVVGDIVLSKFIAKWIGHWLVARRKKLRPDWIPPKLKKGWLTWDKACGWWWWENRPEYHAVDFWSYPGSGYVFENEEIGSVISKILGFPDCTGFDARNCIWEVGE